MPSPSLTLTPAPQCRDRYLLYALDPLLDKSPCRPEEELLIVELHKRFGNKWTAIAAEMNAAAAKDAAPGAKTRRSENWLKVREPNKPCDFAARF